MRLFCALLLLPLVSCATGTNLTAYLGQRSFEDSDIEEVDEPTYGALEFVWGILPWGLGLETGLSYASDDGSEGPTDFELATIEAYVGGRKTFREDSMFRPYIAAGLSFSQADVEIDSDNFDIDEDDTTEGVYARVGLGWHFTVFHLGVDYRYVTAGEFDIDDESFDVDSGIVSVFGGLSF